MTAVIWSGATTASDIFFLIAAVCAGIAAIATATNTVEERYNHVLNKAAICLIALGLLAL